MGGTDRDRRPQVDRRPRPRRRFPVQGQRHHNLVHRLIRRGEGTSTVLSQYFSLLKFSKTSPFPPIPRPFPPPRALPCLAAPATSTAPRQPPQSSRYLKGKGFKKPSPPREWDARWITFYFTLVKKSFRGGAWSIDDQDGVGWQGVVLEKLPRARWKEHIKVAQWAQG